MTGFDAIDALLASARQEVPLPPAEERRPLREALGLSRAQVSQVLGVSPSTVAGWETGRDPAGEVREKYAYFLQGARAKLAERAGEPPATGPEATGPEAAAPEATGPAAAASAPDPEGTGTVTDGPRGAAAAGDRPRDASPGSRPDVAGDDAHDGELLAQPRPCVLCGAPARHQVAGFPQHLDPADCGTAAAAGREAGRTPDHPPVAAPAAPPAHHGREHATAGPEPGTGTGPAAGRRGAGAPAGESRPSRQGSSGRAGPAPARARGTGARGQDSVRLVPVGRRMRTASADGPDLIGEAVSAALAKHGGDLEAATAALVKRAIPDAMALLDESRKGGRYDVVAHPWIPDILRKQTARGADQIWEARPKWARPALPPGAHEVTALDVNGAYLSALKTHLPIGRLEHTTGPGHDRRRAGVHLITPPAWEHGEELPHPVGNRDEPGPLWVTEPTLRLLLRLSGPRYGLCDPPEIHESFTSGATESLLEKFRLALKVARDRALAEEDEVTLEYVKAMYSKFVSTMGESNYNRELYRPDWMHIIRSQAFANLWMKAYKAHAEGLLVVRAMGTDELHLVGDWRRVFPEGRGVSEVKIKDVYTLGEDPAPEAAGEPED